MVSIIESTIATLSPQWAAKRAVARLQFEHVRAQTGVHRSMQQMMSGQRGGYEAGKLDRLHGRTIGFQQHENDIPRAQIHALRFRSWNLYRNCPQARKIRRSLASKVIGRGLCPQPQAITKDGKPFLDFNRRARQVFDEFSKESDWRGKPGQGGQSFVGQCEAALGANLLSGGVLYRLYELSSKEQRQRGLFIPLQVQLLHADRLDETKNGKNQFYGVETDDLGRVIGHWVIKGGSAGSTDSEFVPIEKLRHFYLSEDIDQMIGSPWFGAALLTMDDRRNYEYSELIAAEMASCVVGGYRLSPGQGQFGTNGPAPTELTDSEGNPVTRLQPGMLLNLGAAGEFDIKSTTRPNNSAGEFLSHLIRSEAASVPGVKSSTLTGDYRESSFSSERSADNDIWPEIESLQDLFALNFCQPIFEAAIKAGILAGKFDGIAGFSASDFEGRQRDYLQCNWQGPVSRSINPSDDAKAARTRIQNGTSSPQRECQKLGADHLEILQEQAQHIAEAEALGLPDDVWQNNLGIEQIDRMTEPDTNAGPEEPPPAPTKKPATKNRITDFSILNSA